jgi:hypothetical protein
VIKERYEFSVGDKVQFNAGTGSYGIVEEVLYEKASRMERRYHVRWEYCRDVNGNMMTGTSRHLSPFELKHVSDEEYKIHTDREGWST